MIEPKSKKLLQKSPTKAARETAVDHAVRWASNILVEVLSNHGEHLPETKRRHLRAAIQELGEYGRKE